jgi:hypothetical protein
MDKLDCIKLKVSAKQSKESLDLRDGLLSGKKIFASYLPAKVIIIRIYSPRIKNTMEKSPNELNRQFSKKVVQKAKKYMKKCSTCQAVKEVKIKTTLNFHLSPVRMAVIKHINNHTCW